MLSSRSAYPRCSAKSDPPQPLAGKRPTFSISSSLNLCQVFHSPSLGRTVHQSILDADGRIGLRDKQTKEQKRRKGTLTNAELLEMESQLDFDLSSLSDDLDDQADAMMPTSVLLHQPSESNALVDSFSVY